MAYPKGVNAQASLEVSNPNLNEVGYPGLIGVPAAGTSSTITLDGSASAVDGIYVGAYILLTKPSTGHTVERVITAYVGGTKVATVGEDWPTAPAVKDVYRIAGIFGIAQAGSTTSTLILAAAESSTDNIYAGATVRIADGAGVDQISIITAYDGTAKIATVSPTWTTTPDATSVYSIFGESGEATSYQGTAISLGSNLLHAGEAGAYAGLYLEITGCDTVPAAIGQVRRIASFSATNVATLNGAFAIQPRGAVRYLLHGGWVSEYVNVGDATFVMSQIIVTGDQSGCRHSISSMTGTGLNNNGNAVTHRETTTWGLRPGGTPGFSLDTSPMIGQFYRAALVSFSNRMQGGFRVRLSDSSQTGVAQTDVSGSSRTIGGARSAGELPPLGQAGMASSLPVVIASNQTGYPTRLQSTGGTGITNTGTALDVNIASGTISATPQEFTPKEPYLDLGTTGQIVSSAGGFLHSIVVTNQNATLTRYLKVYDKATAATAADTPILVVPLFAQKTKALVVDYKVSAGISVRATTGLATADTGAPGANEIVANFSYA